MLKAMSEQWDPNDLMSDHVEVMRIDRTGTIWFAAALIAVTLPITGLLISGWRPSQLAGGFGIVWWIGAALAGLGLASIGYAGCPVYWGNVHVAHWQKAVAIRAGLVLFLVGTATALVAILAG
jgi:hypothetical protein